MIGGGPLAAILRYAYLVSTIQLFEIIEKCHWKEWISVSLHSASYSVATYFKYNKLNCVKHTKNYLIKFQGGRQNSIYCWNVWHIHGAFECIKYLWSTILPFNWSFEIEEKIDEGGNKLTIKEKISEFLIKTLYGNRTVCYWI